MFKSFVTKRVIAAIVTIIIATLIAFGIDVTIPCSVANILDITVDQCKDIPSLDTSSVVTPDPVFAIFGSIGSIVSGGLGLVGSVLGNRASARQASISRDFSRELAGTRHQLEVEDLRAAGLNPILSANSNPPIPASALAAQESVATGLGSNLQGGSAAAQEREQKALKGAEKKLADEKVQTERELQKTQKTQQNLNRAAEFKATADGQLSGAQTNLQHMHFNEAKTASDLYGSKGGQALKAAEKLAPVINSGTSSAKDI